MNIESDIDNYSAHQRNHDFYRRRPLILILCFLLFFETLSYVTMQACTRHSLILKHTHTHTVSSPWYAVHRLSILVQKHHIFRESMYALLTVAKCWLASFLLLRIYLLYYDHQYSCFVATNKWKLLMNPRSLSRQKSYFMVNRHRYGDETWLMKNILVPITATCSVLFVAIRWALAIHLGIVRDHNHPFYTIVDYGARFIWAFGFVVLGSFIWRRYPAFADRWLIRREISISLLLTLCLPSSVSLCTPW